MGVMDKFLNAMRLNSDDDEEEYYDDEYYDDDEEEEEYGNSSKRNPFRRRKDKNSSRFDDDDFGEDDPGYTEPSSSKITPMRSARRNTSPQGRSGMAVCVIKPISVEDAREIIETLLSGRTIVLNLEGLDLEIAQRIIDYTSGAVYAIGGNLQKISNYIFIVTPQSVDITGDIQNIMGSFGGDSGLQTDI
ncbi:MAG: cell division protein SepF [Clostridiales bacterium]|nr:cell division protein SepF [Clostridiales bacterium]